MHTTYRDAGVDIDLADQLVERFRSLAQRTPRDGVLEGIGPFAGLFALGGGRGDTVLAASTDGVGTKVRLLARAGHYETAGLDCVAMCVNDILCCGARPAFFLDYLAMGRLDPVAAEGVVGGVARGCTEARCALLGGETAEMPGHYEAGHFDLAGFAVGIASRDELWGPARVRPGDRLVALASTGFHANGFSLVRRIWGDDPAAIPELDAVLAPTAIYARAVEAARAAGAVHAAAHITGGGLAGNLVRALPVGLAARVEARTWTPPELFARLARDGGVAPEEMWRTFNMGVGFVLVVAPEDSETVASACAGAGFEAWVAGRIERGDRAVHLEE